VHSFRSNLQLQSEAEKEVSGKRSNRGQEAWILLSKAMCLSIGTDSSQIKLRENRRGRCEKKIIGLTAVIAAILFLGTNTSSALEQSSSDRVIRYSSEKDLTAILGSPGSSKTSYLLDMEGNVVHKWVTPYTPGLYAELLPNGNLSGEGVSTSSCDVWGSSGSCRRSIGTEGRLGMEGDVSHVCSASLFFPHAQREHVGPRLGIQEQRRGHCQGARSKTLLWDGYLYNGVVHKGLCRIMSGK